jgi:hypothetical protein
MLMRNLWTFATRRAALRPIASTTVLLSPVAWVAGTYPAGSIVNNSGVYYIAQQEYVTGIPGQPSSGWDQYFGPLTVTPWNIPTPTPPLSQVVDVNPYLPSNIPGVGNTPYGAGPGSVGYYTGELTYLPKGDGTYLVFRSTITTAGTPSAVPSVNGAAGPNMPNGPLLANPWDEGTTYFAGQLVSWAPNPLWTPGISQPDDTTILGTQVYQSTVDLNVGNQPDLTIFSAALTWDPTASYTVGQFAWGADNQVYQCTSAVTGGQDPSTDTLFVNWSPMTMWAGTWTTALDPSQKAISNGWQYVPGSLSTLPVNYPITSGPVDDTSTLNAYKLPANYLRMAPANPKRGGIGWLGAPSGSVNIDDEELENDYIISQDIRPKIIRFVTDMTDVFRMNDLFCEALAADIAKAAQPTLQPNRNDLYQRAKDTYNQAIEDAARVNAIEEGSVEPPVDDLIVCRY